jgi:hypothetical protein
MMAQVMQSVNARPAVTSPVSDTGVSIKTEDVIKRLTESEQHDAVHHVVCVLVGRPATPQENDQRSGIPNIGLQQSVS